MAKYDIPDKIEIPQSVGPFTQGDLEFEELGVFEPKQGRDLAYNNPIQNNGNTDVLVDKDKRIPLGTYTLNNRDYWENNNFNKATLQPYLTDNLTTVESTLITTPDGEVVVIDEEQWSVDTAWSVDALPFVVNPNNDEIIHLDEYYDKEIDKENYELATEGKINYYLGLRNSGRLEQGNIDIFSERNERTKTNNTTGFGPNFFDYFIDPDGNRGFYLFKLNWGDGTEIEYTDEPKLLESSIIFEHYYDKPGFYSITGIIYQYTGDTYGIKQYEKFQTNILLNPSPNYELNLYNYRDFASIGGISKNSTFIKSLYSIIGIEPLTQDDERASQEVIEKLNTLDKIEVFDILSKVDYNIINPAYGNFISPYQTPTDDETSVIFGCTDSTDGNTNRVDGSYITDIYGNLPSNYGYMALNYNPDADFDDGTCLYTYEVNLQVYPTSVIYGEDIEFQMPIPRVNNSTENIPRTIDAHRDISIGLDFVYQDDINIETDGDPTDLDYLFKGWYNVNDLDETYSVDGIEPVFDTVNTNEFDLDRNLDLIAIYEYDDIVPPPNPLQVIVDNTESDSNVSFGAIKITITLQQPTNQEALDTQLFKIDRVLVIQEEEINVEDTIEQVINTSVQTVDGVVQYTYGDIINVYDYGADSTKDYTYIVKAVDDAGNESSGLVQQGDPISPIVDIAPSIPTPISLEEQPTRILFQWDALNPNNPNSNIQQVTEDNPVGDFSHYMVKRTQIGQEDGAIVPYINGYEVYSNLNDVDIDSFQDTDENILTPLIDNISGQPVSYTYQVQSVDVNGNTLGFSSPQTITPEGTGEIQYLHTELIDPQDEGSLDYPPGIRLVWPRVYGNNDRYIPEDYPNTGIYLGFEIQKKSNSKWYISPDGGWGNRQRTIEADEWCTIGPFWRGYKPATDLYGDNPWGEGNPTVPTESWPIKFPASGSLDGPYSTYHSDSEEKRQSNMLNRFHAGRVEDDFNIGVWQYENLPMYGNYEIRDTTNSFFDEHPRSSLDISFWGNISRGKTYTYRVRNITMMDNIDGELIVQHGEWTESEPIEYNYEDRTPPQPYDNNPKTLEASVPENYGLTNPYTINYTIRQAVPTGMMRINDHIYFKIKVKLPDNSLGFDGEVYFDGQQYTTEESYAVNENLRQMNQIEFGEVIHNGSIEGLTATDIRHDLLINIVDISGNESGDYHMVHDLYPDPQKHDLELVSNQNGTIEILGGGDYGVFEEGEEVTIIATPDEGYVFDRWTGDTNTIDNVNFLDATIVMDGSYSVSARFIEEM